MKDTGGQRLAHLRGRGRSHDLLRHKALMKYAQGRGGSHAVAACQVLPAHPVAVSEASKYLLHQLGCDDWYVACHHEHLFVFQLTQGAVDRYAVRFQCTSPVEKGIYHGSKAWSMSIIPLEFGAGGSQVQTQPSSVAVFSEIGAAITFGILRTVFRRKSARERLAKAELERQPRSSKPFFRWAAPAPAKWP